MDVIGVATVTNGNLGGGDGTYILNAEVFIKEDHRVETQPGFQDPL